MPLFIKIFLPNASSVKAFTTVKQNQSPLFKERYLEGGGNRKKSEEEEEEIIEGKEGLVEFGGRERERERGSSGFPLFPSFVTVMLLPLLLLQVHFLLFFFSLIILLCLSFRSRSSFHLISFQCQSCM